MIGTQNQNPYNLTIMPINRKKQRFTPNRPADYQPVRRLIYESMPTDTEHLINYIYKKLQDQGILYTLVNKLYQMHPNDISFYIPQLVYLAVKRNCQPLIKFLNDHVQSSFQVFCLIYWNVQAFGFHMKQKSIDIRDHLDKFQKELRINMYNSYHDLEQRGFLPQTAEIQELRTLRNDHLIYCSKFINKLVKTSLDLKLIPENERKERLKAEIVKANGSIRTWAYKNKEKRIGYYEGITIPFRQEKGELFNSTIMVSIAENECSCYNTRKRVPYRIVLETVDIKDLVRYYQPKLKKSGGEKTVVSMKDTFLDDVPEVQQLATPIVDEGPNYKDLGRFMEQIKKQELREKKLLPPGTPKDQLLHSLMPLGQGSYELGIRQSSAAPAHIRRPSINNWRPESQRHAAQPQSNFTTVHNLFQMAQTAQDQIDRQGLTSSMGPMGHINLSSSSQKQLSPPKMKKTNSYIIPSRHNRQAINKQIFQKNLSYFQLNFPPECRKLDRRNSTGDACKIAGNNYIVNRRQTFILKHHTLDPIKQVRYYSVSKIRKSPSESESLLQQIHNKIKNPLNIRRIQSIYEKTKRQQNLYRAYEPQWVEQYNRVVKTFGPWQELWNDKVKRFSAKSLYAHFPSYKLRNCIVKGGDDLRQEVVCMQLIYKFRDIFLKADPNLYLRPYQIIVLNESSGILEFVTNSISIDALKKSLENFSSLYQFYQDTYGLQMIQAQKNFVYSLAAYSLLTYLLQIKDRHNGNILIDCEGHIIHIDFGFIFCISPGGLNFESSPFKMTAQYMELIEGKHSDLFEEFRRLFKVGFSALRDHVESLCSIVQIMSEDSDLPCFHQFNMPIFRYRFKEHLSAIEFDEYCDYLIDQSCFNWRTVQYDYFQHLTNNIAQ